ncbi:hypothetical protein BY996DRAFT_7186161 [Phakopsora pachyrhizi]|nr:hypothetical protein BY996DRAFT_7186161 [Phakopsora pachyrhizi]
MDPLLPLPANNNCNSSNSNCNNNSNNSNNSLDSDHPWPSSPLVRQHSQVIWPIRSTSNLSQPQPVPTPSNSSKNNSSVRLPRSPTTQQLSNRNILNIHNQSASSPSTSSNSSPTSSSPSSSPHKHLHHSHPSRSPGSNHRPSSISIPPGKQHQQPPLTTIRVTAIERNRRDLYIRFDAWSHLITSRAGHCPNVSRAYREFVAFHETISNNNPHTIPPPIPFPSTSAPNSADDDRLVASGFQQFFDRLLLDPSLRTDDELRCFLESDFGYTPQSKPKRRITSGSAWLSGNRPNHTTARTLPSSNSQPGGGPETVVSVLEEDELSSAKLQFRLLEERLGECSRSVEQMSRAKRNHAAGLSELSNRLVQFSTTESHRGLSNAFKRLSQTIRTIADIENNGSVGYLVTLSDGLSWCAVSSKAAKEVLRNRTGVLQEHYSAVKKSIEKRRNIERIKSSSSNPSSINPERIETAIEELESAKKQEDLISQKANLISTNLRPALRIHSKHLHEDLVFCLMENSRTQLIYERQTLKELERLKPELDSISLRPSDIIYETNLTNSSQRDSRKTTGVKSGSNDTDQRGEGFRGAGGEPVDQVHERMIKSGSGGGKSHQSKRVSEISKLVVGTNHRSIENLDSRQTVDAKAAAASLARLF